MNSNFEEIFQGWLEKEEINKTKGFLKKSKYWKKYFCVLRRYEGDSNVYIQWFEKEEEWRKEFPKGSFGLFPKYSVYKHKTEKGKNYFEVSNDEEAHYFLSNNEKTMDLWVIQLMMQTRLSSSMIETSFRVKGSESKCLQRIGAKNLNCLLHVSEWGMTLALERTHSVLSQWPLTTIRNYECTDNNEFVFEAGRKSPMGEGKYEFLTTNCEDNAIFDQLDHFTSLRASRVRSAGGRTRLNSANDEEIAQAYGQLRWSVMLTSSTLNLGVIHPMPSQPQAIVQNNNQVYNHLDRKPSTQSSALGTSYDRLDRPGSLSDRLSLDRSYSRLNSSRILPTYDESQRLMREKQMNDSYDHLERTPSFTGSPPCPDSRSRSFGSLEGRNRFPYVSPPPEDSYNHLSRHRHASLPSSCSPRKTFDFYDKLDRSMASVHQGANANSYDRLDSMQGSMLLDREPLSPPVPPKPLNFNSPDPNAYDTFGNLRAHTPTSYQFVNLGQGIQSQEPLVVDLPPPLPEKPSFMAKGNKKPNDPLSPSSPFTRSHEKQIQPLPPTPSLNGDERPDSTTNYNQDSSDVQRNESSPQNGLDSSNVGTHYQSVDDDKSEPGASNVGTHYQSIDDDKSEPGASNVGTHYQSIDDDKSEPGASKPVENHTSHYQAVDDEKLEPEYAEPRGRSNTHSSNPDLSKAVGKGSGRKGKMDPSKRTTLHRSAPSLALYSVIDKKKGSRGSPKLQKSGSTFKLDGFFKKIGRSSKKGDEETYEKVPRRNKKSQKREKNVVSTSSLRALVVNEDVSYVDIDGEESAHARNLMDRRDSKRPLPDLPAGSGEDV